MFNRIGSVYTVIILLLFAAFFLSSCAQKKEEVKDSRKNNITSAVCVLGATEGNNVSGIIKFEKTDDGVKIIADVEGLTPGKHGFHIHEFGDCSRLDGKSAGGHFNPDGENHAAPNATVRHVGDLGNLVADENGNAHYERIDTFISFGGLHSIIGRGIIVHAGEDDLTSQPTGAAGSRVACGVIGISK